MTISNGGSNVLTSATILYGFDGIQDQIYKWTGNLDQWQTMALSLPISTLSSGAHTFSATVTLPNGGVDENIQNNGTSSSFKVVVNGEKVVLNLELDCYGSETSWVLTDDSNGDTLFSNNGYSDGTPGEVTEEFCLEKGCFTFTIKDSYDDGMSGCASIDGGNGSYKIISHDTVLAELLSSNANFGSVNQQGFCLPLSGINKLAGDQLFVYPNPSDEFVIISSQKGIPIYKVVLWDLSGKICLEQSESQSESMQINISEFASGYYTLAVETPNGVVFKELLIN